MILLLSGRRAVLRGALNFWRKTRLTWSSPTTACGMDGQTLLNALLRIRKIILRLKHARWSASRKEILKAGVKRIRPQKDTHKKNWNTIRDVSQGNQFSLSSDVNKLLITNLNNPDEARLLTDREREILETDRKGIPTKTLRRNCLSANAP